jgi:hypothetical protein
MHTIQANPYMHRGRDVIIFALVNASDYDELEDVY